LLALLLQKVRLVFLDVIFPFKFSLKGHSEFRLLLSTCANLNYTHAKQITEDLDEQAKVTLPTDNDETLAHRDKEKGNST